eukprot:scaffold952_cov409-Prasinococcus_capsulatus_cf.AAC.68
MRGCSRSGPERGGCHHGRRLASQLTSLAQAGAGQPLKPCVAFPTGRPPRGREWSSGEGGRHNKPGAPRPDNPHSAPPLRGAAPDPRGRSGGGGRLQRRLWRGAPRVGGRPGLPPSPVLPPGRRRRIGPPQWAQAPPRKAPRGPFRQAPEGAGGARHGSWRASSAERRLRRERGSG